MRKGFTFDAALCVSCNACNATCMLENGLQPGTRSLFVWNEGALPLKNVINLSMACNHCEEPVCASGCPASAYTIDSGGAVIHHPERCMGCGYCTWSCPYDAPKINPALGYIEKCHFCAGRATEGIEPACVTACPTGALKMTERDNFDYTLPAWFPDTGIKPSLFLTGMDNPGKPEIIPSNNEPEETNTVVAAVTDGRNDKAVRLRQEWSLAVFSILVIAAAAMLIISATSGNKPGGMISFLLMAGAMAVSAAHLGVPQKAWRAVLHVRSSPLSREIVMVLLLTLTALANWLWPYLIPPPVIIAVSLLTLISLDLVYFGADRSVNIRLHSGQAFFTSIYAVSWFIEPGIIFILFSMLAAISVVRRYRSTEGDQAERILYFTRAMALPLVFMLIYPGNPATDIAALALFIAGMTADRLLFYLDFNPPDIKRSIKEHFKTEYEKERDKQRQDSGLS